MATANIGIVGVFLASLGCVRTQPISTEAALKSDATLSPSEALPRISLKCPQFTINPIIGVGGRVVRYSIDQQERDPQSSGTKRFVETIEFRKLTHKLDNDLFAQSFSFKAANVRSSPRVDLVFGLNAQKRVSLTFSLVDKNQFGVEEAENIACTLFYVPDEGSRVKVVEIDRTPKDLFTFKELSHDLAVGQTIWNQSTLAFTSPRDFAPSAEDKALMLQDASGLPLGVFEHGVKKGQGGMKIIGHLVIIKPKNCFLPQAPTAAEPKKTIHGFDTKP